MRITPLRIVLLLALVALIAVVVTMSTIAGVLVYTASRPTPTAGAGYRVPAYTYNPAPAYTYNPAPREPLAIPTIPREPLIIPTREPSAIEQQRDQCERLGYSRSNWPNAGCR